VRGREDLGVDYASFFRELFRYVFDKEKSSTVLLTCAPYHLESILQAYNEPNQTKTITSSQSQIIEINNTPARSGCYDVLWTAWDFAIESITTEFLGWVS
jgi:hypothetical protein